jgi:hypothetical protein
MLPGFVTRGPVGGADEVAAFEGRCGFRLPPDYRQFLLDQNGGERTLPPRIPEEDEDEAEEEGERTLRLLSLGAAATLKVPVETVAKDPEAWPEEWRVLTGDLDWVMTCCRDAGSRSYPPELLPVVEVGDGVLLLRLKGRGTGAVVLCYDPDGFEPGHVNKVAKSFAELLRDFEDWEWD